MYIYASSILDQQYILSLIKQPHKIGDFVSWALLIVSGAGLWYTFCFCRIYQIVWNLEIVELAENNTTTMS